MVTGQIGHTSAEGLLFSPTAYFPLIVAQTLNYVEVKGLQREYWKERHELGSETTTQSGAHRET